jgi:hypothetical protein
MARGGSIGNIAASNSPADNVVNYHDMGREIQLSFYAGPNPYNPPTSEYPDGACDRLFGGVTWPWNPIGAGDIDGNSGQILSFSKNSTVWHIVIRPLQWACHNVSCECIFEQMGVLDANGVTLTSTLHNHRSDKAVYPASHQELPAVYTNGLFYRLLTYDGSKPFTNDPALVEYVTGFRGPGAEGGAWILGEFTPTEHWAALLNQDNFGLGVVNLEAPTFLGGFAGAKGSGGSLDSPTGYIAPVKAVQLPGCRRRLYSSGHKSPSPWEPS